MRNFHTTMPPFETVSYSASRVCEDGEGEVAESAESSQESVPVSCTLPLKIPNKRGTVSSIIKCCRVIVLPCSLGTSAWVPTVVGVVRTPTSHNFFPSGNVVRGRVNSSLWKSSKPEQSFDRRHTRSWPSEVPRVVNASCKGTERTTE